MSAWPCWTRSTILNSSSPNTVTALCEDSTKRARCEPLGRHKHRDVTGGQVGPPPAEGSVEHRGLPAPGGQHAVDEGHLPLGAQCRVVERRPHRALPAARANIAAAVTSVQTMPRRLGYGWKPTTRATNYQDQGALGRKVNGKRHEGKADQPHGTALTVLRGAGQLPEHHRRRADLDQAVHGEAGQSDRPGSPGRYG